MFAKRFKHGTYFEIVLIREEYCMLVICIDLKFRVVVGCLSCAWFMLGYQGSCSARQESNQATATEAEWGETDIPGVKLAEGFHAERVHQVAEDQGSWVSLAVDPKGRLIASDQYGKLYRVSLPSVDTALTQPLVEPIELNIGYAHGLLYAFDSLYVVAHAAHGMPAGLYRVRDKNGDDQFDQVTLLREFEGGGEHGPHAVILGPDQKSLYICGGNHTKIPNPETSLVPQVWKEDQVMPRLWDAGGHAVGIMAPGGWVCKTDPDGKSFELVSIGFRNQFDIAFNALGELFTYDADMEWDIGAPWYRPTRICHVTSGSEFGWRSGTGKWPEFYQDNLPAVVDIGLGSPTGIVFGYGTQYPAKYQQALFACDWSYGVIYAVHLEPKGSSYAATFERFCAAPALPVADIVVNPHDGCLYFVTGGRRVQSGLFRVRYDGPLDGQEVTSRQVPEAEQRHTLEAWHQADENVDYSIIWKAIGQTEDRHLRFAARTALEHQPIENWLDQGLQQADATALIEVITAISRVGSDIHIEGSLNALAALHWETLNELQQLQLMRAYGLLLIRLDSEGTLVKAAVNERFSSLYPTSQLLVNQELARLLSVTDANGFVFKTLELLTAASSQEEAIHYALCLSHVKQGWSDTYRQTYFRWFFDAASVRGGNSLRGFLNNIRQQAIEHLDESTKVQLGKLVAAPPEIEDPYRQLKSRPFVKNWEVEEVVIAIQDRLDEADLENGRQMFSLAQCFACHRLAGTGGIVGPDLTPVGNRYSLHDLVVTLIDPNREVSDQYVATKFLLNNGQVIVGRVVNLNHNQYLVQTDMINPAHMTGINVNEIEEMKPSETSMMPSGLLDNLTIEEICDLIGYLKSASLIGE